MRADGPGRLGVFLDHDPADFGLRLLPLSPPSGSRTRTGLTDALATDETDDSYDMRWLRELPLDELRAIKMELSEAERAMWQRIATKVAERIRSATEHSHALGNLPPPRCRAQRQDRYTFYICCRWDPHPAETGADDEGHRWVPVEP
jgi:hypothetical protein